MGLQLRVLSVLGVLACAPLAHSQCPPRELFSLSPSDAAAFDQYGWTSALDGDTALVSAPSNDVFGNNTLGAVYVLERNLGGANAWGERRRLTPADPSPGAYFGAGYVALDGDVAVVRRNSDPQGGVGSLYIFERNFGGPNAWGQRTKIVSPVPHGVYIGGQGFDLDGDRLAAWYLGGSSGAWFGRIAIYERHLGGPNQWGLRLWFSLPDAPWLNKDFATCVALQGDQLVVATHLPFERVHVFERNLGGADAWGHVQQLNSPLPHGSRFGTSIAFEGDDLLLGAPFAIVTQPSGSLNTGVVWNYKRSALTGQFSLFQQIIPSQPLGNESFGQALALDGDRCVIGAPRDGVFGAQLGSARVFERASSASPWSERARLLASNGADLEYFGSSVALGGATVLVGAPLHDGYGDMAGAVYVFEVLDWAPPASYCTAGTSLSGCVAAISAAGQASASAGSGFVVSASGVDGARMGIVYYGVSGPAATPWGQGSPSYRCVAAPYQRCGLASSGGTPGACDGVLALDWNAFIAAHPLALGGPFQGGERVWIQAWYRDPGAPKGTQLSNGLAFSVCR